MAHLAAGEPAPAEAAARQAVAERPDLADAHEALGAALLAGNRPEEAAAYFAKAQALQRGAAVPATGLAVHHDFLKALAAAEGR